MVCVLGQVLDHDMGENEETIKDDRGAVMKRFARRGPTARKSYGTSYGGHRVLWREMKVLQARECHMQISLTIKRRAIGLVVGSMILSTCFLPSFHPLENKSC